MANTHFLSIKNDDWIESYREGNPIWIATLDDGLDVFRDDGRWDNTDYSAWTRLKKYCEENNRTIKHLRFGFRSNMFNLEDDAQEYVFIQGIRGIYPNLQQGFWKLGVVKDNVAYLRKWFIPEMLPESSIEERPRFKCLESIIPGTHYVRKNV